MLCFVAAMAISGCGESWETEFPSADVSMNPYEDLYRLLSTSKMYGHVPTRVEVSETVATLNLVLGGQVFTRAIAFADTDIQLKHNVARDEWAVDLYKADGKLLLRLEPANAKDANELATVLLTIQIMVTG